MKLSEASERSSLRGRRRREAGDQPECKRGAPQALHSRLRQNLTIRPKKRLLGHPCVLLGDISILIPLCFGEDLPTSQFCRASRASARGRVFIRRLAFINCGVPRLPHLAVSNTLGTPPSPAKSPCRSLKTKELIPPPDGGPERLTDTPTPYGCGKDRWSLDTGRKRSLSRHQKASSPYGCGVVIP